MWRKPSGDPCQRATGPAGTTDHIEVNVNLSGNFRTTTNSECIASPLGQQVELAEPLTQRRQHVGIVLATVSWPVKIGKRHTMTSSERERVVQWQVLFASDHPDGLETEVAPGGGRRTDVVRVRAAERQQRVGALPGRLPEVELELPPLVPRNVRVNEIVTLEIQPHPIPCYALVHDLHHWRRQSQPQARASRRHNVHYALACEVEQTITLRRALSRRSQCAAGEGSDVRVRVGEGRFERGGGFGVVGPGGQ
jgi:hypothetical protein